MARFRDRPPPAPGVLAVIDRDAMAASFAARGEEYVRALYGERELEGEDLQALQPYAGLCARLRRGDDVVVQLADIPSCREVCPGMAPWRTLVRVAGDGSVVMEQSV